MAEESDKKTNGINEEDNSMSTWIGGWFQAAKDKSKEVLDFVKKDLGEFSEAFQKETNYVVSSTTNKLKESLNFEDEESAANSVKRSVSSLLGQISNAFTPPPDDTDTEAIIMKDNQAVIMDRLDTQLYNIRQDEKTYTLDPINMEAFIKFVRETNLEKMEDEIALILNEFPVVKNNFKILVPNQVAHDEFWYRYLFQIKNAHDDHLQRQELAKRAEKPIDHTLWDDDDIKPEMEIPEDVQTKLLEDYEKECVADSVTVKSDNHSPNRDKEVSNNEALIQEISEVPSGTIDKGSRLANSSPACSGTDSSLDSESWEKDVRVPDIYPSAPSQVLATSDKDLALVNCLALHNHLPLFICSILQDEDWDKWE